MLQVGQVSFSLATIASSLKRNVKSNSGTSEIKMTTLQNMGHMQKRLEISILGTEGFQKDPVLEEKVGMPQQHGNGSY